MSNFTPIFDYTLTWEGRKLELVPGDAGGLTWWGVSQNGYPNFPGWPLVESHIKATDMISEASYLCNADDALVALTERFYTQQFVAHNLDKLDYQELALQVFDKFWNMGGIALEAFQGLLGVVQDGEIGPITIAAANADDNPSALVDKFLDWARAHYQNIVLRKPEDEKFLEGWLNRCTRSDQPKEA